MQCPVDGSALVMSDRQGIEIDYCPQCRGVWLDRGEIDKIVERSAIAPSTAPAQQQPQYSHPQQFQQHRESRDDDDDDYRSDNRHGDGKHKRKESWLGELFD